MYRNKKHDITYFFSIYNIAEPGAPPIVFTDNTLLCNTDDYSENDKLILYCKPDVTRLILYIYIINIIYKIISALRIY